MNASRSGERWPRFWQPAGRGVLTSRWARRPGRRSSPRRNPLGAGDGLRLRLARGPGEGLVVELVEVGLDVVDPAVDQLTDQLTFVVRPVLDGLAHPAL